MILSENDQIMSDETTIVETRQTQTQSQDHLHCQKYSTGKETTKALLKLKTKIFYSHSNLPRLKKY